VTIAGLSSIVTVHMPSVAWNTTRRTSAAASKRDRVFSGLKKTKGSEDPGPRPDNGGPSPSSLGMREVVGICAGTAGVAERPVGATEARVPRAHVRADDNHHEGERERRETRAR